MRSCGIDTDHGAIRVVVAGERDQFFEIRTEQEVEEVQDALDVAIITIEDGTAAEDFQRQATLKCYAKWGEHRRCVIETSRDALRISCIEVSTARKDCFLELRAEQVGEFRDAFDAAVNVFHGDVAIYGEHWADEGDDSGELSPSGNDDMIRSKIENMVKDQAPHRFALVETVGERMDATIIAWGLAFRGHVEIMSNGRGVTRGVFRSAERALRLLAGTHHSIRLVWV
jgi:hypothetical protein